MLGSWLLTEGQSLGPGHRQLAFGWGSGNGSHGNVTQSLSHSESLSTLQGAGCAGRANLTLTPRWGVIGTDTQPKNLDVTPRQKTEVGAAREAQQTHPTPPPLAFDAWRDGASGPAAITVPSLQAEGLGTASSLPSSSSSCPSSWSRLRAVGGTRWGWVS